LFGFGGPEKDHEQQGHEPPVRDWGAGVAVARAASFLRRLEADLATSRTSEPKEREFRACPGEWEQAEGFIYERRKMLCKSKHRAEWVYICSEGQVKVWGRGETASNSPMQRKKGLENAGEIKHLESRLSPPTGRGN